jgi:hypothetical protein
MHKPETQPRPSIYYDYQVHAPGCRRQEAQCNGTRSPSLRPRGPGAALNWRVAACAPWC